MDSSRLLDCLAADFARMRAVVATDPTADVPSCPGWTVADGAGPLPTDVTVSGSATAVLRWLWNRNEADLANPISVEGVPEAVEELRHCIVTATQ